MEGFTGAISNEVTRTEPPVREQVFPESSIVLGVVAESRVQARRSKKPARIE